MARGDLHRLTLRGEGREQTGTRLCVVVQSDALLLSTVVVAPTSTKARPADFRAQIMVKGTDTRVLLEQVKAVDGERLGKVVGQVTAAELERIDDALRLVMGLW